VIETLTFGTFLFAMQTFISLTFIHLAEWSSLTDWTVLCFCDCLYLIKISGIYMSNITQPHKANTNSSIEYNDKKCSSIT
jgi:hypothetical protein